MRERLVQHAVTRAAQRLVTRLVERLVNEPTDDTLNGASHVCAIASRPVPAYPFQTNTVLGALTLSQDLIFRNGRNSLLLDAPWLRARGRTRVREVAA